MNTKRISLKFEELQKQGRKAFIPFLTAGDPNLSKTEKYAIELERAGADLLELGLPFTDPLADGVTIQAAHERALKKNIQLTNVLQLVKKLRKKIEIPIILMTSYNLVMAPGAGRFIEKAASSGVDGLILPDLPPEEANEVVEAAHPNQMDVIFLAAPTSTPARLRKIAESSSGFIYLISLTGTTGARKTLPQEISDFVSRVRSLTKKPLAIGFGISTPDQARQMARLADGVIVGSAIVEKIAKGESIYPFAKKLADAVHSV